MGLPGSHGVPRAPCYSGSPDGGPAPVAYGAFTRYGGPFQVLWLGRLFCTPRLRALTPARRRVWAGPRSLAATWGVAIAFLSSGYLDVSVHRVRSVGLCIQPTVSRIGCPSGPGCPIRVSGDQRLVGSSSRLIAASYALHRLPTPRHSPCALSNLTTLILVFRGSPDLPAVRRVQQEPSLLRQGYGRQASLTSLRTDHGHASYASRVVFAAADTTTHFAAIHFSKTRRPCQSQAGNLRHTGDQPRAVGQYWPARAKFAALPSPVSARLRQGFGGHPP